MKLLKNLFCCVLVFAMILSLTACGGADSTVQSEQSPEAQQQTPDGEETADVQETADPEETADAEEKIVITDQLGKTIEFDESPERLATTIMPFPYIFHAVMGNSEYMVGCNPSSMKAYEDSALKYMYTNMANADTSWVDTSFVVNVEELLKLQPDVVFQWTHMPEEIEKMEAAGLKVIALKYGTLDDLETWIKIISQLYQQEERGEELISYFHESVDEVAQKIATLSPEDYPTIIQLYYDDLMISGTGFGNYWVEQSGAVNPAKELAGDDRKVDMEKIYEWNPDILYIGNFVDIQPSDIMENKLEGQDWSLVQAVKDGEVYKIPIGGYRWDPPGVETPLMIKWLAKIQHPELFADMDMRQEVKDFYKEVYHFDLTEEMLSEILDDTQN